MSDIKEILSKYKKIAMVGVSNDPQKASTIVMKYMQKYGFKVYPVNPKAKGKKIFTPVDKKTRPLKDMVRESIFNIISHSNLLSSKFEQSIILDLFSGVGSFGLEAISRGAKKPPELLGPT